MRKPDHFEVGDVVRIRAWDDMANEYGLYYDQHIETPNMIFTNPMKRLCGTEYVIERIVQVGNLSENGYLRIYLDSEVGFIITDYMIEHVEKEETLLPQDFTFFDSLIRAEGSDSR